MTASINSRIAGGSGAGSWGEIGGTVSDQADLQAALDLKAPKDTPTFTGPVTAAGAQVASPTAMAALSIDITKINNTKAATSGDTYTFSASPSVAGQTWGAKFTNSASTPAIITIPTCWFQFALNTIAALVVPAKNGSANGVLDVGFRYDSENSRTEIFGAMISLDDLSGANAAPTINSDSADGFAVASLQYASDSRLYGCLSPSAGAAKWSWGFRHRGVFAFASLPTSGVIGEAAFASDLGQGLSAFEWKTIGGVTGWFVGRDTTLSDVSVFANLASNTNEQICNQYQIPAGVLRVGDRLRLWISLGKTGLTDATNHIRVRWGAAGTTADQDSGWDAQAGLSAARRNWAGWLEFTIMSATTARISGLNGASNPAYAGSGGSSDPTTTFTIPNVSGAIYVTQTAQLATAVADTLQSGDFRLVLMAR